MSIPLIENGAITSFMGVILCELCYQGYGLFTLEEHRYSPEGFLFTRGPGMYKIPGFTDIPVKMNCSLLKGSTNPRAVYSSKVSKAEEVI